MDLATYLISQVEEEMDEEAADDETQQFAAVAAIAIGGALADSQARINRRHESRVYLCRPELLPNPRLGTPWQSLYLSRNDRAYITTMGFDVHTFNLLLASGFGTRWDSQPIPRHDSNSSGQSRPNARSLDAAGALGLVLHYLNSTMREISLQEIFALVPTTVSRYITFSLNILLQTLKEIPEASIQWPRTLKEFEENSNLIIQRHPRLSGAFGSIDGLALPVQESQDEDFENATYNGWKAEHFISSVLVFAPQGNIIAAHLNAPGSWHDSRVARPIYSRLREETPDGFYLVADSAFPQGTQDIAGRIQAPLKAGRQTTGTVAQLEEKMEYNSELLSYRQTAEWGMRAVQGAFGRLRIPLEVNHNERRGDLIETCVRLHNLRTQLVGINQIRTVYLKEWRRTKEDEAVWDGFEDMLFSEQRRNDRVQRFHIWAEEI